MIMNILAVSAIGSAQEAGWSDRVPRVEGAANHFTAPEGKDSNPGTKDAPWDLGSTLAGKQKIAPGAVVWVRGGTYKGKFEVKLAGKEGAPIHVRAFPGERAKILDSGLTVNQPTAYLWIWNLEIAGSAPVEKRETKQTGSWPSDLPGTGGLTINAGKGCKYINLDIHDNVGGGVGWWIGDIDSEFHGCLIYGNGWRAPDRGHGHCIYTQNKDGIKTISGCIMSVPFDGSYTMHAYGSGKAYVDNFVIEDNIAFEKGPFLIGGGRPSHNIKVSRNYLCGVNLRIGYGAQNEDCEVRGNVVAKGSLSIEKYKTVVDEGNAKQFAESKAFLIPNKYDPNRANVAVFNGAKAGQVGVDVGTFLKSGESYRLLDAKDFFGKPLAEGQCSGRTIDVPMKGEFAALVLLKAKK